MQSLASSRPRTFIQIFNPYTQPGGEQNSVVRIGAHLELAGHKVVRFWRASEEWQSAGAPSKLLQPFLLWNNNAVLAELQRLHSELKPDAWILHNIIPIISIGVYALARRLGVPIVHWLHNYRPISPGGALRIGNRDLQPDDPWLAWKETLAGTWHGRLLTGWLSWGYARARRRGDFSSVAAWIAVSDAMRKVFERAGYPASRLFTLRHAWDMNPAFDPPRDEGYFVFLGRIIEEKGVRFLIDLWRRPEMKAFNLVMAGEGALAGELARVSPPNVRWVGFVKGEEKRRLVAGCRAILFPCLWTEPLSTVAYEAYEQSKPIFSSALGGMIELIKDGETGRLLPPAEIQPWLDAIQQIGGDAELSRRYGANGHRWLTQNVSPQAWIQGFDEILAQALPARP